ncbi:MAG: hypothetical protein OEZ43_05120 [Gammaproteobacteria bacterium]|nr:hypothetical protein [Gammaproteobacteria bacterium]
MVRVLLTLFVFVSAGAGVLNAQDARAAGYILSAEGSGPSLDEAKAAAVTELGKSIIAKVESTFRSDVKVNNDQVNRDMQSIKQVRSDQLLKGVRYSGERQDGEGYHITAGLDQSGVNDTVNYMREQLDGDLSVRNREQLGAALKIVDHMQAFISTVPKIALSSFPDIDKWLADRRHEILQRMNQGRVEFISPVPEYTISIDGKSAVSGQYFPPGHYQFSASAEGYRSFNGTFSVSEGEIAKVNLPFVKVMDNKSVSLQISDGFEFLHDSLKTILEDMGVAISSGSKHEVKVTIDDEVKDVDGFSSHSIKVQIVAMKNGKRVNRVRFSKNMTAESGDQIKLRKTLQPLVEKGMIGLFSRMEVEEYFSGK